MENAKFTRPVNAMPMSIPHLGSSLDTDLSVVGSDDSDVGAGDPDLGGEELLDVVDDDLALLGVEEGRAARLARVRALQRVEYHGESRLQMISKFDHCNNT